MSTGCSLRWILASHKRARYLLASFSIDTLPVNTRWCLRWILAAFIWALCYRLLQYWRLSVSAGRRAGAAQLCLAVISHKQHNKRWIKKMFTSNANSQNKGSLWRCLQMAPGDFLMCLKGDVIPFVLLWAAEPGNVKVKMRLSPLYPHYTSSLSLLACLLPHILFSQHNTAQHSTAQHSTAQHSTAQHSTTQHSTTQHNTAQLNKTTILYSSLTGISVVSLWQIVKRVNKTSVRT